MKWSSARADVVSRCGWRVGGSVGVRVVSGWVGESAGHGPALPKLKLVGSEWSTEGLGRTTEIKVSLEVREWSEVD